MRYYWNTHWNQSNIPVFLVTNFKKEKKIYKQMIKKKSTSPESQNKSQHNMNKINYTKRTLLKHIQYTHTNTHTKNA